MQNKIVTWELEGFLHLKHLNQGKIVDEGAKVDQKWIPEGTRKQGKNEIHLPDFNVLLFIFILKTFNRYC